MKIFIKEAKDYKRDFNIIEDGLRIHARYISLNTGMDFEKCLSWVKSNSGPGKKINLTDPKVRILYRDETMDRRLVTTTFNSMLDRVNKEELIVSPSLTCYFPPETRKSIISEYQESNIAERNVEKALMLKYQREGNVVKEQYHKNTQGNKKRSNNAVSGTHTIPNNPFYIKSAHSTLTSTCRTITSYTNSINEKFIAGNRHYWCPDVAVANLLSIIDNTDLDSIDRIVKQYNLNYPTVDDVMECIARGSELEWYSRIHNARIRKLVEGTSPVERAAFMYVSDFYHLYLLNKDFAIGMLVSLGRIPEAGVENPDDYISLLDNDQKILASLICCESLKLNGKALSIKECSTANPEGYKLIGACAKNIIETVNHYADFYRVMYTTSNLPGSINYLPDIKRRAVPGSDTDSSIVTVQFWTHAVTGAYGFTDTDRCVAAAISYLATQVINHVVATVCGNMGISDQYKFTINMKNEWLFPVFSLTGIAKHYYAYQLAKEGNILAKLTPEIKGVHLRSSRLPSDLKQHLKEFMEAVMQSALSGGAPINRILNEIMYLENKIEKSVLNGESHYMMRETINETYSVEDKSKLIHWHLWKNVFARKYGETPPPPYRGIKVKMNLPKKKDISDWLDTIKDPYIKAQMAIWIARYDKTNIGNFILPINIVGRAGIPEEIRNAIDTRLLKQELLSGFYLVLKSLGLFIMSGKIDTIVSDFHHHYDPNDRLTKIV